MENQELTRLAEENLMPKGNTKNLLVSTNDDETFSVKLRKPPKVPLLLKGQPLESKTALTIMQKFTKTNGHKKYPLHRYPRELQKRRNVYRNVEMMDEDDIRSLTGFSCEKFWSLVEQLSKTKLPSLVRSISLPSAVLLYR